MLLVFHEIFANQFPSNVLQREEKFNNEPKNILNDTDYGSFGRGENIGALVQSIMSPLSSCPNIYGNANKKQINAAQNYSEDTDKSVSLIASVTNLLERKDLSQIPNPRKILQSSLDKHTSSSNLISVVSPLVPNENQVDSLHQKDSLPTLKFLLTDILIGYLANQSG